jgi:hypothetical protein
MTIEGATDTEVFRAYVTRYSAQHYALEMVVIMDNLFVK